MQENNAPENFDVQFEENYVADHPDVHIEENKEQIQLEEDINIKESIKKVPTNKELLLSFLVVLGCYFANVSFVFGRGSTSLICTALVKEKIIDEGNLGQIVAAGMFGMLIGSAGFGIVLDKVGTKYPILLALISGMIVMVFIFFFNTFWYLIVLYFIFNFFAIIGNASMSKIARKWVPESKHGLALGFMATSSNTGRILGLFILGGAFQLGMNWRWAPIIIAGILFLVLTYYIFIFVLEVKFHVETTNIEKSDHPLNDKTLFQALFYFITSLRFWVGVSISVFANSSAELFSFLPLYFVQDHHIDVGYSGFYSSTFAFGCAISIFVVGALEDKISKIARMFLYLALLSIGTVSALMMIWGKQLGVVVSSILLFILGLMTGPSTYVSYNTFLVNFGGPFAGTLYSIMELFGSVGRVFYDLIQGYLIEHVGWKAFWSVNTGLVLSTNISTLIFLYILARRPL